MNVPRESISTALFNILAAAYPSGLFGNTTWASVWRREKDLGEISSSDQPAMILFKGHEEVSQPHMAMVKWVLNYLCVVYFQADASQDPAYTPETAYNSLMDGIDKAMAPRQGEKQTLGGLITNAWMDGPIPFLGQGTAGAQQCAIVIPIKVLTGM